MGSRAKMYHPNKENMTKDKVSQSLALEREKIEKSLRIILAEMKSGPSSKDNLATTTANKADHTFHQKYEKDNKHVQLFHIYADPQNTKVNNSHNDVVDPESILTNLSNDIVDPEDKVCSITLDDSVLYAEDNIDTTTKDKEYATSVNAVPGEMDDSVLDTEDNIDPTCNDKESASSVDTVPPGQMDDSGVSFSSYFDDTPSLSTPECLEVSLVTTPKVSPPPLTAPRSVSPFSVSVPPVSSLPSTEPLESPLPDAIMTVFPLSLTVPPATLLIAAPKVSPLSSVVVDPSL